MGDRVVPPGVPRALGQVFKGRRACGHLVQPSPPPRGAGAEEAVCAAHAWKRRGFQESSPCLPAGVWRSPNKRLEIFMCLFTLNFFLFLIYFNVKNCNLVCTEMNVSLLVRAYYSVDFFQHFFYCLKYYRQ